MTRTDCQLYIRQYTLPSCVPWLSLFNIQLMNQLRRLVFGNASLKPLKGFQAVKDSAIRAQVVGFGNPKLDALAGVLQSLANAEVEYLNLLLADRSLKNGLSVLSNKIINTHGYAIEPISYAYQQEWVGGQWKEMNLLQFALNDQVEEAGDKVEVQAVKENYDVELTSVDPAQKIKIIKALREIFNLGLKEAKDLADKTPSMIKKNMKKDEAEKLKKDLEASGCVVTLK